VRTGRLWSTVLPIGRALKASLTSSPTTQLLTDMAKCIIPADGDRKEIVIYSRYIESINAFLTDPLTDSTVDPAQVKTRRHSGGPRRRGPSDQNPINVPAHDVRYLYDPSLKSGNALPGFSFILKTDLEFADIDMQRSFTMTGTVVDFQQYFNEKMKYDTFYYPSIGGRHKLLPTPLQGGG